VIKVTYYKYEENFDFKSIEGSILKLAENVKKILWGKNIRVVFSCKLDDLVWYNVLIEIIDNYLTREDLVNLNKFMNNSNYIFHSVELNSDFHIILKYVR